FNSGLKTPATEISRKWVLGGTEAGRASLSPPTMRSGLTAPVTDDRIGADDTIGVTEPAGSHLCQATHDWHRLRGPPYKGDERVPDDQLGPVPHASCPHDSRTHRASLPRHPGDEPAAVDPVRPEL